MLDMTGVDVPRPVRAATVFTWLLAPAGLLLVLDGLWELRWWGSPAAARLLAAFAKVQAEFGAEPPPLLRGRSGAVVLIVLGVVTLACAMLAPLIYKGRLWARTWSMVLGIATLFVGLASIGADAYHPQDLSGYLSSLAQGESAGSIPLITSLMYPGWYSWLEDIAQGLQVLASAAAVAALVAAVISHRDYFTAKRAEAAAPDEWDAAISRLHRRTVGDGE